MKDNTLKTASVLAFERKLDPSDALFYAGTWSDRDNNRSWPEIPVVLKSVRGTISNRLKTKDQDPAKLDAAIANPNLQTVDVAMLPANADTLKVAFSLRVLAGAGKPSACNDPDYQQKLQATVQAYVQEHGFTELSKRYAYNLANGRFLWRNRMGAEQISIQIEHRVNGQAANTWVFDALALSLHDFDDSNSSEKCSELAQLIEEALRGNKHVLLHITAFVRMGEGQEVFPSQELILDKSSNGKKSRTLYTVAGIAGMHSQKLGNAIRSIDTWYEEGTQTADPIAVEPYGSVTTQGKAYRQPKQGNDFYSLLDKWLLKDKVPAQEQQHFVMAVLVRGGVFGDAGKE